MATTEFTCNNLSHLINLFKDSKILLLPYAPETESLNLGDDTVLANQLKEVLRSPSYTYFRKQGFLEHYDTPEFGFSYPVVKAFQVNLSDSSNNFKIKFKNYDTGIDYPSDYLVGWDKDFIVIRPNGTMYVLNKDEFQESFQPYLTPFSPPLDTDGTPLPYDTSATNKRIIHIHGADDRSIYHKRKEDGKIVDYTFVNLHAASLGKGKLNYRWEVIQPGSGSPIEVLPNQPDPIFKATKIGTHTINLTIIDSYGVQFQTSVDMEITQDPYVNIIGLHKSYGTGSEFISFSAEYDQSDSSFDSILWQAYKKNAVRDSSGVVDPDEFFELKVLESDGSFTTADLNDPEKPRVLVLKPELKKLNNSTSYTANLDGEYEVSVTFKTTNGETTKTANFEIVDNLQAVIDDIDEKTFDYQIPLNASKSLGTKQVISFSSLENWVIFIRGELIFFNIEIDFPNLDQLDYYWELYDADENGAPLPSLVSLESNSGKFAVLNRSKITSSANPIKYFSLTMYRNDSSLLDTVSFYFGGNELGIIIPNSQPKKIFFNSQKQEDYNWKIYSITSGEGESEKLRLIKEFKSPEYNRPLIYYTPPKTGQYKAEVNITGVDGQKSHFLQETPIIINRRPRSFFPSIPDMKRLDALRMVPVGGGYAIEVDASNSFSEAGISSYEWIVRNKTFKLVHKISTNEPISIENLNGPDKFAERENYKDSLEIVDGSKLLIKLSTNTHSIGGLDGLDYEVSLRVLDNDQIYSAWFNDKFRLWFPPSVKFQEPLPIRTEGAVIKIDAELRGKMGRNSKIEWTVLDDAGNPLNFPNTKTLKSRFQFLDLANPIGTVLYKIAVTITDDFGDTARYPSSGYRDLEVLEKTQPIIQIIDAHPDSDASGELVDFNTIFYGNRTTFSAAETMFKGNSNSSNVKYDWKLFSLLDLSNTAALDFTYNLEDANNNFTSFGVHHKRSLSVEHLEGGQAISYHFDALGLYEVQLSITDADNVTTTTVERFGVKLPPGPVAIIKELTTGSADSFKFVFEPVNPSSITYHWAFYNKNNLNAPITTNLTETAEGDGYLFTNVPVGKYIVILEAKEPASPAGFGRSNITQKEFEVTS